MSEQTTIEWTGATLSPWCGCTQVSEGCAHCYVPRTPPARVNGVKLGAGQPRYRVKSFRTQACALNRKAEREGRRIRVFPSLCDWLDPEVPVEWLADFLDVIRITSALDWQLLTKRPVLWSRQVDRQVLLGLEIRKEPETAELRAWLADWLGGTPPANVWIGWTAENQARADERTPHGLNIPAVVRFVSVEPMLGPVVLGPRAMAGAGTFRQMEGIHWVICGGESGPGARPMHPDWARWLRDQCAAAGVPFFFKQWGEWAPIDQPWEQDDPRPRAVNEQWLNVAGGCGYHGEAVWRMRRVGKQLAGRLLDGREHNEVPEVRRG